MGGLRAKVAYLKGLIDGSGFPPDGDNAGAIWGALVDILDEMTESIEALEDRLREQEDYIEAIDSDLLEVEDELYGDEEGTACIEVECPNCGAEIAFEEELLADPKVEIRCNDCGELLFGGDDYHALEIPDNGNGDDQEEEDAE